MNQLCTRQGIGKRRLSTAKNTTTTTVHIRHAWSRTAKTTHSLILMGSAGHSAKIVTIMETYQVASVIKNSCFALTPMIRIPTSAAQITTVLLQMIQMVIQRNLKMEQVIQGIQQNNLRMRLKIMKLILLQTTMKQYPQQMILLLTKQLILPRMRQFQKLMKLIPR